MRASKQSLSRCVPRVHPLCRPPRGLEGRILRLLPDGKTWRNDNGDPGRAFLRVGDNLSKTDATIWVANCRCVRFLDCPVARALARATSLGCDTATVVRRRPSPKRRKAQRV